MLTSMMRWKTFKFRTKDSNLGSVDGAGTAVLMRKDLNYQRRRRNVKERALGPKANQIKGMPV